MHILSHLQKKFAEVRAKKSRLLFAAIFGSLAGVVLVTSSLIFLLSSDATELRLPPDQSRPPGTSEEQFRSLLNGVPMATSTERRPFAIVIDNHIEARPPSGVADASLVFEFPVEGGITRLLLIMDGEKEVREVGPIRSARPYMIDWSQEFDAPLLHVGGSPAALERIYAQGIPELDEYAGTSYYWRSSARFAPHNVYTSSTLLAAAREKRGWTEPLKIAPWLFKDAPADSAATATSEVTILYSTAAFTVRWRWDPVGMRYLRVVGTVAASDKNGTRHVAKNVAVAFVEREVLDSVGRLRLGAIGSGRAMMLRDGNTVEGTWRKESVKDRLRFYDSEGNEFVWRPGVTWIQVVPNDIAVSVK